ERGVEHQGALPVLELHLDGMTRARPAARHRGLELPRHHRMCLLQRGEGGAGLCPAHLLLVLVQVRPPRTVTLRCTVDPPRHRLYQLVVTHRLRPPVAARAERTSPPPKPTAPSSRRAEAE